MSKTTDYCWVVIGQETIDSVRPTANEWVVSVFLTYEAANAYAYKCNDLMDKIFCYTSYLSESVLYKRRMEYGFNELDPWRGDHEGTKTTYFVEQVPLFFSWKSE